MEKTDAKLDTDNIHGLVHGCNVEIKTETCLSPHMCFCVFFLSLGGFIYLVCNFLFISAAG